MHIRKTLQVIRSYEQLETVLRESPITRGGYSYIEEGDDQGQLEARESGLYSGLEFPDGSFQVAFTSEYSGLTLDVQPTDRMLSLGAIDLLVRNLPKIEN